jgi:preprotein translocase SecE subunit
MAIVKTTPKQTGSSSPTGSAPNRSGQSVEVAKAGGAPSVRPAVRPGASRVPQSAPKPSRDFLSDTRAELKKVVWPSREDVRGGTIVTVLLLVAFGAYIFGLDRLFESLFNAIGVI